MMSAPPPLGSIGQAMRRRAAKLTIFLALFAAGAAVAGLVATRGLALDTTTTLTETSTTVATTTEPAQTVLTTATVEQTTTRQVVVPARTTTSSSESSGNSTPTWVWVLLGVLAVAVVILLVVLLTRRGGGSVSADERARRLDAAVNSWAAQGYAVESKSAATAVVRRGGERIMISVDPSGAVSSQHLAANDWPTA
jgi:hypothetical protein